MHPELHKTIALLRDDENNRWAIGTSLNRAMRGGASWRDLDALLANEGLDYKTSTLRAYARVTAAFPAGDRIDGASFAAHQAALTMGNTDKARKAMQRVIDDGRRPTRDSVLAEVRKMKGRTAGQTSDAVAAWRDLRRGVEKLLGLSDSELAALLTLDSGRYAGEASKLSSDLGRVSVKVSSALTKAEKQAQAKARRTSARVAASATPKTTKAPVTKPAEAPAAKTPKLGRLGSSRGQG
jgi:hypothetical protein